MAFLTLSGLKTYTAAVQKYINEQLDYNIPTINRETITKQFFLPLKNYASKWFTAVDYNTARQDKYSIYRYYADESPTRLKTHYSGTVFPAAMWEELENNLIGGSAEDAFAGCYAVNFSSEEEFGKLSKLDMSEVTNIAGMFRECVSLTSLDLHGWNLENCTTISKTISESNGGIISSRNIGPFSFCASLAYLDVSGWNTKNIKCLTGAFKDLGIRTLDLSSWDTSNATDMQQMFYFMSNLRVLDISNFSTKSIDFNKADSYYDNPFYGMFSYANGLIYIIINKEATSVNQIQIDPRMFSYGELTSEAKILVPENSVSIYQQYYSDLDNEIDALENYDIIREHGGITVEPKNNG